MGLFSWLSSSPPPTKAPDRSARQVCWGARDAYFACLDAQGVLQPGLEGDACKGDREVYEGRCAKSWIEYFNKRRVLQEEQRETLAVAEAQAAEAAKKSKWR